MSANDTRTYPWGVRVRAAARLTFSMIDLNGSMGRRNGVASLAISNPHFQASVFSADRSSVSGPPAATSELEAPMLEMLAHLQDRLSGPSVRVTCESLMPQHVGLGSKTTILLAVAKAYAALSQAEVSTAELAKICKRGGTSGASVNLIDRGGFLVDGGHQNPLDFDEDPGIYLVPSRKAGAPERIPPVLVNAPFPAWPILLIKPRGAGLSGSGEYKWFEETFPLPLAAVQKVAHLVLMGLAPAIAEANYGAFCQTLNRLTFETLYKQEQIKTHSDEVRHVLNTAMKHGAIDGIGISSQGPTCFAFTRRPNVTLEWLRSLQMENVVESFSFTTAQNHPYILEGAIENDCTV
jgi:beta-ribofuranosylaminobenzene 5'-phosphate synthase